MGEKPIDLEAVRRADARLKQLLEEHPELREPNPERQEALEAWLESHLQEDTDDATSEDR
jgi:cytochrome c556